MLKRKQKLEIVWGPKKQGEITIHDMHIDKPYRLYDVKCDRSSLLGSPFHLNGDETKRNTVCDMYDDWFHKEVLSFNNWAAYEELMRIRDIYRTHLQLRIFCWCAPKRCHCLTIKTWLENNR